MSHNKEIFENTRLESNILSNLSYIKISDKLLGVQVIDNIVYNFKKKGLFKLGINKLNKWNFEGFLKNIFKNENIKLKDITAVGFSNGKLNIYLKTGEVKTFDLNKKLDKYLLDNILKGTSEKEIEKRVKNLVGAIEKIFSDNNFLINGEINDKDILKTSKFGKDLKGKTLKELKQLLDEENKKLYKVYDITGEAHKKQELLKEEIKVYTGIGDDYEGGAGYFRLSNTEIEDKINKIGATMSIEEVFEYIKKLNKDIDRNFKRSDLVEQVNLKLINGLYNYTFERLKKENGTNKQFIELIKIMTGRGKLEFKKGEKYSEKQGFDYENKILSFEMSQEFVNTILANQVLIYLVYKPDGLLEEIKNKNKNLEVKVFDEELEGKTPNDVYLEAETLFNNSVHNKISNYGKDILEKMGYSKFFGNTDYFSLSFEEKIEIGALYRIIKEIKSNGDISKINEKGYLEQLSIKVTEDTFNTLNDSLSDNFDESLFDWDGTSAEDLGLKGTYAEIFELYQDINGNEGVLDWKDSNIPGLKTIAFGISLLAGILILGPIFAGGATSYTFITGLIAGAKLGFISSITFQGLSHQGYESYEEGFYDVGSQLTIDTILSSIFTASGLKVLQLYGGGFTPNLLSLSKEGLLDKGFIIGEGVTTTIVSSIVSDDIKRKFIKNHVDVNNKQKVTKIKETIDK